MKIVLDTNIWINGLRFSEPLCMRILENLTDFTLLFPSQVRQELDNNLRVAETRALYQIIRDSGGELDYAPPPDHLEQKYFEKGLRKGDMTIAAFCEWRNVDVIVSTNRDFLRGISGETPFLTMSPDEFCEVANI